jgi:putative SOS response-associated peptidase YedK
MSAALKDHDYHEGRPGALGWVVRRNPETAKRHMDELSWGLLPRDTRHPESAPRPTHARAETVATLPMFADAFRCRRAIIPATEYFERNTKGAKGGQRFAISRLDGKPLALAGLWEGYRSPDGTVTRSYCVITTEANELVATIHDRMPLVLEEEDFAVWLGEVPGDPAVLLRPPAADGLLCRSTGRA